MKTVGRAARNRSVVHGNVPDCLKAVLSSCIDPACSVVVSLTQSCQRAHLDCNSKRIHSAFRRSRGGVVIVAYPLRDGYWTDLPE